jgi:hypothetical protein
MGRSGPSVRSACTLARSTGDEALVQFDSSVCGINQATTDPMGELFLAAFDQSQRSVVVFAAKFGYLRPRARVVSYQALKPFTQILAVGRVLFARLSEIESATARRRPIHSRMADSVLRPEGQTLISAPTAD